MDSPATVMWNKSKNKIVELHIDSGVLGCCPDLEPLRCRQYVLPKCWHTAKIIQGGRESRISTASISTTPKYLKYYII